MNDNQPLRRWAIGAALCLTLTYPLMATASEPASEALQQALTQRIQQSGEALPVESFYQLRDGQPAWHHLRMVRLPRQRRRREQGDDRLEGAEVLDGATVLRTRPATDHKLHELRLLLHGAHL